MYGTLGAEMSGGSFSRLMSGLKELGYKRRRLLLGVLLLALAAMVVIRTFVYDTGYDATLVSDVGDVRAPMAGSVEALGPKVGMRVRQGEQIGTLAVPVSLAAAVKAGSADTEELTRTLESIDDRMAKLRAEAARVRGEARDYRSGKSAQLGAQRAADVANVASADARLDLANRQLARIQDLNDRGFSTRAALDSARSEQGEALAARNAAASRQAATDVERGAAGRGLLLSNGYSDVQYSTQRLSEITLALNSLQGERDRIAISLDMARKLSSSDGLGNARQFRLPLRASVDGLVWTRGSVAGDSVREGDPIFILADCSSFYAYFVVGKRAYSMISVGTPVTFRPLVGKQRWPGRVVNLGVGDPSTMRFTSQIPAPPAGKYLVGAAIALPEQDRKACPVGVAGRVIL